MKRTQKNLVTDVVPGARLDCFVAYRCRGFPRVIRFLRCAIAYKAQANFVKNQSGLEYKIELMSMQTHITT